MRIVTSGFVVRFFARVSTPAPLSIQFEFVHRIRVRKGCTRTGIDDNSGYTMLITKFHKSLPKILG